MDNVQKISLNNNLYELIDQNKTITKSISDIQNNSQNNFSEFSQKIDNMYKQLNLLCTINTGTLNDIKHISDNINASNHTHIPKTANCSPNTQSPHLHTPKPVCEPYIKYEQNAITPDMRDRLIKFVEDKVTKFQTVGDSRDVVYFGKYGYRYTGGYHAACDTPYPLSYRICSITFGQILRIHHHG